MAILVIGVATYLVNRQSETLWVMVAIQVSALVVFKANQQRKKFSKQVAGLIASQALLASIPSTLSG